MTSSPDVLALLARVGLFDPLPRRSLKRLARRCVVRDHPAGAVLIEEGGTGLGLYILVEGSVEVTRATPAGRQHLATLGAGEVVGELALIDDRPRSASVTTVVATRTLLVTRNVFRDLVRRDPEVAWLFVPVLADRVRELQDRLPTAAGAEIPDPASTPVDDESRGPVSETTPPARASRPRRRIGRWLRLPSAVARASLAALPPAAEAGRELLDTFDDEAGLDDPDDEPRSASRLPRAVVRATAAAIRRAETIPETVLASLRHHLRRSDR